MELWVVTCINGDRHYFSTRQAADNWAYWGHFCHAQHTITKEER